MSAAGNFRGYSKFCKPRFHFARRTAAFTFRLTGPLNWLGESSVWYCKECSRKTSTSMSDKGELTVNYEEMNIYLFMYMFFVFICSNLFSLKECLSENTDRKDQIDSKLQSLDNECSHLKGLVNESRKTEQILLDRISKLEQTLLSLGRERSEIASECAERAGRMRNLIFLGIDETMESDGCKRRVIEQGRVRNLIRAVPGGTSIRPLRFQTGEVVLPTDLSATLS